MAGEELPTFQEFSDDEEGEEEADPEAQDEDNTDPPEA